MNQAEALGQRLREAREARELSLLETERATRIRAKYLEALEAGDYVGMSPVQAQGFLRNYARFLGLDLNLLLVELEVEKPRRRRRANLPDPDAPPPAPGDGPSPAQLFVQEASIDPITQPQTTRPRQRRTRRERAQRGPLWTLVITLLAAGLTALVVLGLTSVLNDLADRETRSDGENLVNVETLTPLAGDDMMEGDMLGDGENSGGESAVPSLDPGETGGETGAADTPSPSPTPITSSEPLPHFEYTPPTLTGNEVLVDILIVQRTWIRITADDAVVFEGVADVGTRLRHTAQQSINVRATNAAGVELTVNNQPQGVVGGRGQLFDHTFTLGQPPGPFSFGTTATSSLTANPATASPQTATLLFTATLTPLPSQTLPLLAGDGGERLTLTATVTRTPRPAASDTPTGPTNTPSFTPIPTLTPSNTPTDGPSPTPSFTPIATLTPSDTPTVTPTPSRTPRPTRTSTPSATPQPTATAIPSETPSPTRTPRPTLTATSSQTPSLTRTPTPTRTYTPSLTPTLTVTPSPTQSPTRTPFLPPRLTRTPSPAPK